MMITHTAFQALEFSVVVVALALLTCILSGRWAGVRRAAVRIAVMFGVFALAAGYIWFRVAPELDYYLEVRDQPLRLNPAPYQRHV